MDTSPPDTLADFATETVDFYGEHQAGIETPIQAHVAVRAFTLTAPEDMDALARLLRVWTEDSARLTQGEHPVSSLDWEFFDRPARVTVTVGMSPDLLRRIGVDAPEWLAALPAFPIDELDPIYGTGDLMLQVCSDDPFQRTTTMRFLTVAASDYATVAWTQEGFAHANGALTEGETPRNFFGQLDGTVNPRTEADFEEQVWIDNGPDWMQGGSTLVIRRIRMDLDDWDLLDRPAREVITGRSIDTGAPLSGGGEFTPADVAAVDETGLPVIDPDSHMARAMPRVGTDRFLRRVFNYSVATPAQPEGEVGLIFMAYQANIAEQYLPVQQRLAESDRLNQWTFPTGSSVFFIPPGVEEGEFIGEAVFRAAGREA